jgi:hypothetical protein
MKPSLIALFLIANLLSGCTTSGSNPVADMPLVDARGAHTVLPLYPGMMIRRS